MATDSADAPRLKDAVAALTKSIHADPRTRHLSGPPDAGDCPVPEVGAVAELLRLARSLIFPGFFDGTSVSAASLDVFVSTHTGRLCAHAERQIGRALRYMCGEKFASPRGHQAPRTEGPSGTDASPWAPWPVRLHRACVARGDDAPARADCAKVARQTAAAFIRALPEVRRLLSLDVLAAFDGDPAAEHTDEIILCYPGLTAMLHHRLAHTLYGLGVPLLPRMIAETAHRLTGIDIHPGARIGERFFVDHGAGTVIGETSVIGDDVKIYQGVTLGAKSFDKDAEGNLIRGTKRHPTIGSRATIYAGAVILGGDTLIGHDCVINGGVFLTQGVPPGHIVRQKQPELTLRSNPAARPQGTGV